MQDIQPGKWQHYKGNVYKIIGIARHTETLEEFVVYHQLEEGKKEGHPVFWVRPKDMFTSRVTK